ncbi:hypothetical protein BJY14_005401 [Actinomadura luteofluorescens]|uniref:Uncharacterized protein n=1 Tax=Actinomadura luteofluorescens TaxID=46163 RepID=A0A7Y9JI91_9ACTN|nr:hypothetical protein [Actinomadura luteofluorescens]NYD49418.1 hypothetical protein [Actinomadura luteofluorescens]
MAGGRRGGAAVRGRGVRRRAVLRGRHVRPAPRGRDALRVDLFDEPGGFRDYFKSRYGPTISVYERIAGDPDKVAALDEALAGLARDHDRGAPTLSMDWEYLLVTARRAG